MLLSKCSSMKRDLFFLVVMWQYFLLKLSVNEIFGSNILWVFLLLNREVSLHPYLIFFWRWYLKIPSLEIKFNSHDNGYFGSNAKSKEVNSEIPVGHLSKNLEVVFFLTIGLYSSQYHHLCVLYLLLFLCSDVKRCWCKTWEHLIT